MKIYVPFLSHFCFPDMDLKNLTMIFQCALHILPVLEDCFQDNSNNMCLQVLVITPASCKWSTISLLRFQYQEVLREMTLCMLKTKRDDIPVLRCGGVQPQAVIPTVKPGEQLCCPQNTKATHTDDHDMWQPACSTCSGNLKVCSLVDFTRFCRW